MIEVFTVFARIRAAEGKAEALASLLVEQAAVVRAAEPGCLVYRVHGSTRDPRLFVFYEQYADEAAFDAHRNSPHIAAFRARREREGLADGPADVEVCRALTE